MLHSLRVIRLDSVSKQHGKQILFMEASCALNRGEKVGLVGPNGAGKSTIFRMIMKEEAPDGGSVAIDRGTTIGYFSQDVGEMHGKSVVAATLDGAGAVSEAGAKLHELEHALADPANADKMEELVEQFGEAQARFEELGGYALEARAREILAGLGFSQEVMDGDVGALSGGWKMRVALARILLMKPDAMLLDEPTNHLDLESIHALVASLRSFEGSLVFVSHDRAFVSALATRILEVTENGFNDFPGTYDEYLAKRGDDHLDADAVVLRAKKEVAEAQTAAGKAEAAKSNAQSWEEQKKKKNRAKQLPGLRDAVLKSVEEAEARKAAIHARWCEPGFFEKTPAAEVAALEAEEKSLGPKIEAYMREWEALEQEIAETAG